MAEVVTLLFLNLISISSIVDFKSDLLKTLIIFFSNSSLLNPIESKVLNTSLA